MITQEEWKKNAKIGAVFYSVDCFAFDGERRNSVIKHEITETRNGSGMGNYALCLIPLTAGSFSPVIAELEDYGIRGPLFQEQCFWTVEEAEAFAKKQKKEELKGQIVRIKTELNKAQKKLDALEKKENQ
jgi:hypothetical protein